MDEKSGRRFLVNTGAEVSLLPAFSDRKKRLTTPQFLHMVPVLSHLISLYLALFHIGSSEHRYPGS